MPVAPPESPFFMLFWSRDQKSPSGTMISGNAPVPDPDDRSGFPKKGSAGSRKFHGLLIFLLWR
jgi:hypothetical protein